MKNPTTIKIVRSKSIQYSRIFLNTESVQLASLLSSYRFITSGGTPKRVTIASNHRLRSRSVVNTQHHNNPIQSLLFSSRTMLQSTCCRNSSTHKYLTYIQPIFGRISSHVPYKRCPYNYLFLSRMVSSVISGGQLCSHFFAPLLSALPLPFLLFIF